MRTLMTSVGTCKVTLVQTATGWTWASAIDTEIDGEENAILLGHGRAATILEALTRAVETADLTET